MAKLLQKLTKTGLSEQLKNGLENLSGISMDDVKVHYNSDKPNHLKALTYAQGTDIHLAANQEKHLPHEAWHVVAQAKGKVKPTKQTSFNIIVSDDCKLETEANILAKKSLESK